MLIDFLVLELDVEVDGVRGILGTNAYPEGREVYVIDQYDGLFPAELPLERRNDCSAPGSYDDRRIHSIDLDKVNYHPLEKLLGGQ